MNSWITLVTHSLRHLPVLALILDAALNSFLILLVASIICFCWRRSTASTRHLVWFLAVTGLLCLPVFSYLVPKFPKPLWVVGTQGGAGNELTLTFEFAPAAFEPGSRPPSPALSPDARPEIPPNRAALERRLSAHINSSWVVCGMIMWFGGVGLVLLTLAFGRWRLQGFRGAAREASHAEWTALLDDVRRELGLRRNVILLQSEDEVMPITWGLWRPITRASPGGAAARIGAYKTVGLPNPNGGSPRLCVLLV
jgi:hypothetical protein